MTKELQLALGLSIGAHAAALMGIPLSSRVEFDVERAPTSVEIVLVAPKTATTSVEAPVPPPQPETPSRRDEAPEPSPRTIVTPEQKGALTEVLPNYLRNPAPVYPTLARERGEAGTVLLDVEVLASGSCGHLRILRSSGHELLDEAARQGISRWRFKPARRAGVAVTVWVEIPVTFRLLEAR
ncbi:MAG: energy transducer TonB [Candidatus Omnitrophica bacterium]|nr:energy transducer TonB [Candidatus Omnitrophota bacterium]